MRLGHDDDVRNLYVEDRRDFFHRLDSWNASSRFDEVELAPRDSRLGYELVLRESSLRSQIFDRFSNIHVMTIKPFLGNVNIFLQNRYDNFFETYENDIYCDNLFFFSVQ